MKIPLTWRGSESRLARLFWLGLALLFAGLFLQLSRELREDAWIGELDRRLLAWAAGHRIDAWNGPAVDVTALGSASVLFFLTLLGGGVLAMKRDWPACAYLVGGSAGSGLITFLLKHHFSRPRPDLVPRLVTVSGYSYPSGHSLSASSFYLLVMFLAWRAFPAWPQRLCLLAFALALIGGVACSRVYLGAHYPSDVLSGLLLGASWACLLTSAHPLPKMTNL